MFAILVCADFPFPLEVELAVLRDFHGAVMAFEKEMERFLTPSSEEDNHDVDTEELTRLIAKV